MVIRSELYYIGNGTVEKGKTLKKKKFERVSRMSLNQSEIEEVIKTRVAPILRLDGGSIEVAAFNADSRALTVRFGGAYRGSPCRGVVLRHVVLPILKQSFGELETLEMED